MNSKLLTYSPYLFRLLFISFFLPGQMFSLTLIAVLTALSSPVIIQWKGVPSRILYALVFMLLAYLFYVAYIPFTAEVHKVELYFLLERKAGMFLIPIAVMFIGQEESYKPFKELLWFVGACIVWLIIVNLSLVSMYDVFQMNHVRYRDAFESIGHIHPTYMGIYIGFALSILLFSNHEFPRWINALSQVILIVFLALIAPKISLLFVALLYIYAIGWGSGLSVNFKSFLLIFMVVFIGVLFYFVPFFHQRVLELTDFLRNKHDPNTSNSLDYRRLILDIDLNLLKEHWLVGVGPGRLAAELNQAFDYSSFLIGLPIGRYNTHNEFLNQWLSFGLVGFIYFVGLWILHIFQSKSQKSLLYFFLILLLILTCLTENILSRQHGVLFSTLFLSMFFFQKELENP